jgi:hypothetical protein
MIKDKILKILKLHVKIAKKSIFGGSNPSLPKLPISIDQ